MEDNQGELFVREAYTKRSLDKGAPFGKCPP